jgi:hypothetical protein
MRHVDIANEDIHASDRLMVTEGAFCRSRAAFPLALSSVD